MPKKILLSFITLLYFLSPAAGPAKTLDEIKLELSAKGYDAAKSIALGSRLYNVKGTYSCTMCHGANGKGGVIAEAAHLDDPRTWKVFQSLGGEAAFSKDRAGFLSRLEATHLELLRSGAVVWNTQNHGQLNPLMYGIKQAPTLNEIQAIQKELKDSGLIYTDAEMQVLASHLIYQYVKTMDEKGVFKAPEKPKHGKN